MKVKQVSIFLENRQGRLAAVTKALGSNEINIRAFSVADTADFGVVRLIVNDPNRACDILRANGFMVTMTDVLAVEVPDKPGGLAYILEILQKARLNIEYLYAFVEKRSDNALVIFRLEDIDTAFKVFEENNVSLAPSQEVYQL
jgi:hypothetical protein